MNFPLDIQWIGPFPKWSKHLRAPGPVGPATQALRAQMLRRLAKRPNPLNIQGEIRWLRGKSIEYEREPLRLRDLINGKKDFAIFLTMTQISKFREKKLFVDVLSYNYCFYFNLGSAACGVLGSRAMLYVVL